MATATEPTTEAGATAADGAANKTSNKGGGSSSSSSKDYYGYLFEDNKTPTKTLDALLRAIAKHIIDGIGDRNDDALTPGKLAAFYKAVGGDYDKLFVNAPHESISYIWQVFGCQHTLQPTGNDFEQPSVPALTLKGFVRWESIQILLAPDEHVPFVLDAVRKWHLRNPDTGELFPASLSATSFPSEPDPEITAWHAACGDKLKKEATPKDSPRPGFTSAAERVNAGFSHVPAFADAGGASRSQRPAAFGGSDYFNQPHRPVPFSHVSPSHAPGRYGKGSSLRVSPERGERVRFNGHGLSPEDERARRRSFSDYPSPHEPQSSEHLHIPRPGTFRRHSHPRRFSDDDSETDSEASPRTSRRGSAHYPHRSPKVVPHFVHVPVPAKGPPSGTPPVMPNTSATAKQGSRPDGGVKLRPDERESPVTSARRKTAPVVEGAKDWAKDKFDKFSGIFGTPSPGDRPRRSPGNSSGNVSSGATLVDKSRDSIHGSSSRLSHSHSYDDDDETESEREREHREAARRRRHEREKEQERAARRDRERDAAAAAYERDRHRVRRSRDTPPDWDDDYSRDRDRDRDRARSRRDKEGISAATRYVRRPDNTRRTSSHADIDRIDREKHNRMYDLVGDRRDRDRYVDDSSSSRRRRAEDRERDRDRDRDRGASPVIKGVGGRKYPTTEPPWTAESP